jgi:hypothetical protein
MRKYFNKINIEINSEYRHQLRSRVINEYYQKQTMNSANNSIKKSNLSWLKKLFLLAPIPALIIIGILLIKKPAEKNQPSNFLVQAQEVYEQDLAKQQNSVLHQIIKDNSDNISEIWRDIEGNMVIINKNDTHGTYDKTIFDINQNQEYSSNDTKDLKCFDSTQRKVYCHVAEEDNAAQHQRWSSQQAVDDSILNSEDNESRLTALQAILNSSNFQDKGVINGNQHLFELPLTAEDTQYYIFEESTYRLLKTGVKLMGNEISSQEYIVDEYLDESINDIPEFVTRDNLYLMPLCSENIETENALKQIESMPTGCYEIIDGKAEAVKDVSLKVEIDDDVKCSLTNPDPDNTVVYINDCDFVDNLFSDCKGEDCDNSNNGDTYLTVPNDVNS